MKPILIIISAILAILLPLFFIPSKALAISNPLVVPNNKFGIHLISATAQEASEAAQLVNSQGGDWGYVTIIIESKNRDHDRWQTFFNELRRRHLIPLVRIATEPQNGYWKKPYDGEEQAWADFLDNLVWPTKNRYIIIYNEPNQGMEWASQVDPKSYAQVLDKTITALKNKSSDFFVLNAGFDASAPNLPPLYQEESSYLIKMNQEVPGIFNRLNGWVSHSYPNPGFIGSPMGVGKISVKTFAWELQFLRSLGITKNLPVFITETGWKHAEGLTFDYSLPSSETVAKYYQTAFSDAWIDSNIVSITPFLLNYQEFPFDHFSFKRINNSEASENPYYPIYQSIIDLPKISGIPDQKRQAELIKGGIYSSLVSGENYQISLTFKNSGQSIWNDGSTVELKSLKGGQELGFRSSSLNPTQKIEPGQEATFIVSLHSPNSGTYQISLQMFDGSQAFDSPAKDFIVEVKQPVILNLNASLGWKRSFAGDYLLSINSAVINKELPISLNNAGESGSIETKYLIPDQDYQFTLSKPFYKSKAINSKVTSGINILKLGSLNPDILSVLLKPKELWHLLPFSN